MTTPTTPAPTTDVQGATDWDRYVDWWESLEGSPTGAAYNGGTIGSGFDAEVRLDANKAVLLVFLWDVAEKVGYFLDIPVEAVEGGFDLDSLDTLATHYGEMPVDLDQMVSG